MKLMNHNNQQHFLPEKKILPLR
uniref:Uncharacterized protein n=1 Tax=Rhizophora mucronata TaxID=61149 RepID=A0A2P2M804_RHIMU